MTAKHCPHCDHTKPLAEFHPRHDRPGQVHSWCKDCRNAQRRAKHNRPRKRKTEPCYLTRKRRVFAQIMGGLPPDGITP